VLLSKILAEHGFAASVSEAKRLIVGGCMYVDMMQVTRPEIHIPIGSTRNFERRGKQPISRLITVKMEGDKEVAIDSNVGREGVLAYDIRKNYGVHAKGTRVRITCASQTHPGLYEAVGIDSLGAVIYDRTMSAREYIQGVALDWITFDT